MNILYYHETPRHTRHLEYFGQFTTNIQHSMRTHYHRSRLSLSPLRLINRIRIRNNEALAKSQKQDKELKILRFDNQLQFKNVHLSGVTTKITCNTSTGTIRPYLHDYFGKEHFFLE